MPRNQQRNQLSSAYWTTSRNGGDVTTRDTELSGSSRVSSAGEFKNLALPAMLASVLRTSGKQSLRSCFDFLTMSFETSRRGGVWLRFVLIFRCDATETA